VKTADKRRQRNRTTKKTDQIFTTAATMVPKTSRKELTQVEKGMILAFLRFFKKYLPLARLLDIHGPQSEISLPGP